MIRQKIILSLGLVVALAVGSTTLAATAGASALSRTSTVQEKATITANYESFFKGTTPAKTKIKLLQNGASFTAIIDAQSSSSIAKSTTAKVTSVTIKSSTLASVKYTIYLAGQAALKNQSGEAVYQKGTWKVGTTSFCALLSLEQTKTKACPST